MLELLKLKPEVFGLDISDLSLKIAKLKKKGKFFTLASFGEEEIKPGIIREGEIKDEDKLAEIIKESLKKVKGEKLRTKYVVASLPEEKSFLQVIKMPYLSEEDLKSAIIYEAENYIPLPIEQVYLDFQVISPINSSSDQTEVLLVALPQKIVDSYVFCFKKAGLQPIAMEVESLAIARALIQNEKIDSPILLIDFGQTRTSFIVYCDRSIKFTSSISVSSGTFTEIISKFLGIDLDTAEKLKREYGLERRIKMEADDKKTERREVFEALAPALVDLTQQIKRYLEYYQTHASSKNKKIEKILICGGGANLKGLPEILSLELKIPVELGNPWINILPDGKKELPQMPYEKSLGYTTALGLALRGIKYD